MDFKISSPGFRSRKDNSPDFGSIFNGKQFIGSKISGMNHINVVRIRRGDGKLEYLEIRSRNQSRVTLERKTYITCIGGVWGWGRTGSRNKAHSTNIFCHILDEVNGKDVRVKTEVSEGIVESSGPFGGLDH